jgi:hypothetical protein
MLEDRPILYRTVGDQSLGEIRDSGAIDTPAICGA